MSTITLTGNYGYTPYSIKGLSAGTTINAETASWIHDNDSSDGKSNLYPVAIDDSPAVILQGGTIVGNIDQTSDWRDVYSNGNSAALRTENTPNVIIRDWRITDTWDAIRVSWGSKNFLIEDVWITNARDDAVENDKLNSGTIRDSLFDGVLSGISLDPSSSSPVDGHNETVTVDGVLLRMQSYLIEGDVTHGSPIKPDSALGATVTPQLHFTNNVFAIEDVDHNGYNRLVNAWKNTVESSNNYYLNLSDTPLPSDYPMPPKGWTILQGQAARDYWNNAKTAWIAKHEGDIDGDHGQVIPPSSSQDPAPGDTSGSPAPSDGGQEQSQTEKATFSGTSYSGSGDKDTIIGNDLNNMIVAKSGDDVVKGGLGNDTIEAGNGADSVWGGAGNDTFVFRRGGDVDNSLKAVDIYRDFEHGADKFDLSLMDPDVGKTFAFIGSSMFTAEKPGQVRTSYDAAHDVTRIELNTDSDARLEYHFTVSGKHAFTAADFIL